MAILMPYSGKPINKMTYDDLQKERMINLWFAARMVRLYTVVEYGLWNRREECDRLYNIEESEKQFERGEIDENELKRRKKNRKMRQTYINKTEAEAEFCRMQEINARAIVAMIDEELRIKKKPPTQRKKPFTPYRRFPDKLKNRNKKNNSRRLLDRQNDIHKYTAWQNKIEKLGLGELWDREKFELICADRGYVTKESMYVLVSRVLNITIKQVPALMKNGAFTWGQVLSLGATLYMTPKEFADTFMRGYFIEIADGVFEATSDNLPDFSMDNNPDK